MIIGQNRCEELATPNVWRKINSTTQRVSYSTLLSGFVIVKHGPLMLACMSKLHVINLIQSVRHELGHAEAQILWLNLQHRVQYIYNNKALGNLEIIDSLVEIGEFFLNMYVIFLFSQLHLWHKRKFYRLLINNLQTNQ